jgi:transcriptional repressor NrdR
VRSAEKRPVTSVQMETAVDNVERRVREFGKTEVPSSEIGEFMMEELVNLDEIAYIRFASVYRQFKDMSVFLSELEDIVKKAKKS